MKTIIRVSAAMRTEVCILHYELQNKNSQKRNRIEKIVINEDHKDNRETIKKMHM